MSIIISQQTFGQNCKDNIQCYDKGCEMKHPRILAGVCINHILGICQNDRQCDGLQHFSFAQLKKELKTHSINGVYLFNICRKNNCSNSCRYVHPLWKELICWKCLSDNDEDCELHSEAQHDIKWLQNAVYNQYDIQECNPENLCPCNKNTCVKKSHQLPLGSYCIEYFQGTCPHIICSKYHVTWEEFKNQSMQQNYKQQVAKPCIKFDQNQNIKKQNQEYSAHIFQPKRLQQELTCAINQEKVIDIIFILDCTSSMQKWIDLAKNSISMIMREFERKIPFKSIVRIAAVCYRDLDCQEKPVYHNFTTHPEIIEKFLGQQVAYGGEDIPEDLIGALEQAYSLNISTNELSLLNIFIMTDAPCHGKRYHDLMWDEYSDKCDGQLEIILEKIKKLKSRLFVTFFYLLHQENKSNRNTEKMEKIMQSIFQDQFFTASIGEKQFLDYIKFSLQTSLHSRARMSTQAVETHDALSEKQQRMDFNYEKTDRSQSFLEKFQSQLSQQKITQETVLKIETSEYKIPDKEKGKFSAIYKAFDTKKNSYIVLKIPKNIVSGQQTEEEIKKAEATAETMYTQQIIAQQLMTLFNKKISQNQELKNLIDPHFYSQPTLYKLKQRFLGLSVIYGETFINFENQSWTKYSNNLDHADQDAKIIAFSHFTFDVTNEELLITDLQGKLNLLSDPAIHTRKNPFWQSESNFELLGIQEFFKSQHPICNEICGILQLKQYEQLQQPQPQKPQICQQLIQRQLSDKHQEEPFLLLICSNCGKQDDLKKNAQNHFCFKCSNEANNGEQVLEECQCCKEKYYQNYRFQQLEATVKLYCSSCKANKCSQSNASCCYCKDRVCLVFKYRYDIGGNNVNLCIDAVNYLKSLKCQKCNKQYSFQKLLSHEDYSAGKFECC